MEYIRCPDDDASLPELDEFGISYDGYRRIAGSSERLLQIVRPIIKALDTDRPIPSWAGLDLLRASLFYVHRRGHYTGPSPELERQFRVLIAHIRTLATNQPLPRDPFC